MRKRSGRQQLLNTPDDMQWLRDVHVKRLPGRYKSAVIYGNEDCPTRIDLYKSATPTVDARPRVLRARGCTFTFRRRK